MEGPPYVRVKSKLPAWPARTCLHFWPPLSLFTLESPTVHWHHPPWSISPSAFSHAITSIRDSDEQIESPSGTSPPGRPPWFLHHPHLLYHLCTHPPPISRHSNIIPNNHYPCLYLPLFVALWRAGDAPYSSVYWVLSTGLNTWEALSTYGKENGQNI